MIGHYDETYEPFLTEADAVSAWNTRVPLQKEFDKMAAAYAAQSFKLSDEHRRSEKLRIMIQKMAEAVDVLKGADGVKNHVKRLATEALRDSDTAPLETSPVRWEYEDVLPPMTDEEFAEVFAASKVDVVRMYPYVEGSDGRRIWITQQKP